MIFKENMYGWGISGIAMPRDDHHEAISFHADWIPFPISFWRTVVYDFPWLKCIVSSVFVFWMLIVIYMGSKLLPENNTAIPPEVTIRMFEETPKSEISPPEPPMIVEEKLPAPASPPEKPRPKTVKRHIEVQKAPVKKITDTETPPKPKIDYVQRPQTVKSMPSTSGLKKTSSAAVVDIDPGIHSLKKTTKNSVSSMPTKPVFAANLAVKTDSISMKNYYSKNLNENRSLKPVSRGLPGGIGSGFSKSESSISTEMSVKIGGANTSSSTKTSGGYAESKRISGGNGKGGKSHHEIDLNAMVSLKDLRICLDPEEEFRLKTELAMMIHRPIRCETAGLIFFIKYPESGYTIKVDIYNPKGYDLQDRCTILHQAIRCVSSGD